MTFTIHVLTPGENVYNIYRNITKHFPVSKLILLKDIGTIKRVEDAILAIKKDCDAYRSECEVVEFDPKDIESEISAIINIRKRYPDAKLYFNITPGKKDYAILAFMASVWVNGTCYYLPAEFNEPFEFPMPKVSVKELAENKLHVKIIESLACNDGQPQAQLLAQIPENPNNHAKLSPQTLSQSLRYMERNGLVTLEREGRKTIVTLKLSGRIAYAMIQEKKK